ncbi:unnamed protein product [Caenorhabditis nigoni]
MPIALLKLPYDLLGEVLKECNPFELYCLSKCSKRFHNSVKWGAPKDLKIYNVDSRSIVILGGGISMYSFICTPDKRSFYKRTVWTESQGCMHIEFPDGIANVFGYLIDILKIRNIDLLEDNKQGFDYIQELVKAVIDKNSEIQNLKIWYNKHRVAEEFMSLVNQSNITGTFTCYQKFPADFQHTFVRYPNSIDLSNSFWFTRENLMECSCVRIELKGSLLGNKDLDIFLRKWKTLGTFPNLECLFIESQNIDEDSPILEMIPPIRDADNEIFGVFNNVGYMYGVQVIKEDGTVGWLKVELPILVFKVDKSMGFPN